MPQSRMALPWLASGRRVSTWDDLAGAYEIEPHELAVVRDLRCP